MSPWLLGVVAVAYLWVGYSYFRDERIGMGVAFIAYAISNIGFILDAMRK